MFNWFISHPWLLGFYILTIWTSTPFIAVLLFGKGRLITPTLIFHKFLLVLSVFIPVWNVVLAYYVYNETKFSFKVVYQKEGVEKYFTCDHGMLRKITTDRNWFMTPAGKLEQFTIYEGRIFGNWGSYLADCSFEPHYLWKSKLKMISWVKWLNPIYYLTAVRFNKF